MEVSFREITTANFRECVQLKVRDDQPFVAANVYSIAQAKVEPKWITRAIYADDQMVGFLMYELNHKEGELYLCRFMVDHRFQHMGFGRAALEMLKRTAMADPSIYKVVLSTSPKNEYGIRVYTRFGFQDTGILHGDEEVFELDLGKDPVPRVGNRDDG